VSFRQGIAANCSPPLCLKIWAFSGRSPPASPGNQQRSGVTTAILFTHLSQVFRWSCRIGAATRRSRSAIGNVRTSFAHQAMRLRNASVVAMHWPGRIALSTYFCACHETTPRSIQLERQRRRCALIETRGLDIIRSRNKAASPAASAARIPPAREKLRRSGCRRRRGILGIESTISNRRSLRGQRIDAQRIDDCRNASPNRPRHGRDRRSLPQALACARVIVLTGLVLLGVQISGIASFATGRTRRMMPLRIASSAVPDPRSRADRENSFR